MESKDWSGFGYFSPDFSPGIPVSQRIWTPRSKSANGYRPPFADLDPPPLPNFPFKHPLYHIWSLILFASFLSMFLSITTQHSSIKVKQIQKKQPFRSNSTAFIIASSTAYASIRCEQTTAFESLKCLQ